MQEAAKIDTNSVICQILEAAGKIHEQLAVDGRSLVWVGNEDEAGAQAEQLAADLKDMVWRDYIANLSAEQINRFKAIRKERPAAAFSLCAGCPAKTAHEILEAWQMLRE